MVQHWTLSSTLDTLILTPNSGVLEYGYACGRKKRRYNLVNKAVNEPVDVLPKIISVFLCFIASLYVTVSAGEATKCYGNILLSSQS